MKNNKIVVGITHGDINSISYEVILKSLFDDRILDFCIPIVYGSPKIAAYYRKTLNIENFSFNNINNPEEAHYKRSNIINCVDENIRVEIGKSTKAGGEAACNALEAAVQDLHDKKIDVLVTGPIDKYNIQSEKFQFAGHTEFLESKFKSDGVLMLMVSDMLKTGVVTGHVPLSKVPEYITKEAILNKLRILNKTLISDFGIRKPKIAVLGLNPHAGDQGILGEEEIREIQPALDAAREENMIAMGPFSADGFFGSGSYLKFDTILAMYHDQGLTPFKTIVQEEGVNYTAGLPVVRTSPAHGTAFEIAGKGIASPESFRKAIYLACDIFKTSNNFAELNENPLKSYDTSAQ